MWSKVVIYMYIQIADERHYGQLLGLIQMSHMRAAVLTILSIHFLHMRQ